MCTAAVWVALMCGAWWLQFIPTADVYNIAGNPKAR